MSQTATTNRSPPERLRKPNDDHGLWLLRRIWDRVNRDNEHFMGVIVGREGSGKSFTALKIASMIDPTFDADRVIFDVADLLEVLRDGDHDPGNFYVLDEAGVQFGVRSWQERGQVLANQALQLVRDHNLGLIFTLPRLGELDSQTQGRLQAFLELIDKEDGEHVTGKWKWLKPDRTDETGEIYKPYPRRRMNGNVHRITRVAFSPPDDGITDPYKEKKSAFQQEFYDEVISELRDEDDEDDDEQTVDEILDEIDAEQIGDFVSHNSRTGEPYIDSDLLRIEYDMTHRDSRALKSMLEKRYDTAELKAHV